MRATGKKTVIIYHAAAGRGIAPRLVTPVRRWLTSSGGQVVKIFKTRFAGHAQHELATSLAEGIDSVVVIGGDGTLREVAAGLIRAGATIPVGFIPTGSANVVARDQGIPLQSDSAIALLTTGRVKFLDVGMMRTRPQAKDRVIFLAMAEIGFGARVVELAHRLRSGRLKSLYRRWGDPVYALAALMALASPTEPSFQLYQDGSPLPGRFKAAIMANTRCYAKGWAMAPHAHMGDGRLDLVARRRTSPGILLRAFHAAARRARPPQAFTRYHQGRRFRLQSDTPFAVQMDGDPLPPTNWLEVAVLPGKLQLIVP